MPVERGDSSSPVGGTSSDVPSTFEQSTLKGTTTTGGARLIVRDATQIQVIDTSNYWTALTVEGVLEEIAGLAGLDSAIQDQIDALTIRVAANETDKVAKAGDTMTGSLLFGDSIHVLLGTGSDLDLYHNGGNGVFKNSTGNLFVESATETIAAFTQSAVKLYFESSQKLETVTGGISVTGTVVGSAAPTVDSHLTRKDYVDTADATVAANAEDLSIAYAIALGG